MRVLLVVPLLALAGIAGCLDDDDSSIVSARTALGPAEREARDWSADAQLASILGIELNDEARAELASELEEGAAEADEEHDECLQDAEDDVETQECHDEYAEVQQELDLLRAVAAAGRDVPGDGRSALWMFGFLSESQQTVLVVGYAGGKVQFTEVADDEGWSDEMWIGGPLTDWSIDSDDAARIARTEEEAYAAAARGNDSMGFISLFQTEERPVWLLGLESDDEDAWAAVDAANGTLIPVQELFEELFQFLFQESGTDAGSFTAVIGDTAQSSFSIDQRGHGALVVHVRVQPSPVDVDVTVTDPLGATTSFTVPIAIGLGSEEFVVLSGNLEPGAYQVELSAQLALQQQWEVSWCTDGIPLLILPSPFFDNPACDEVPNGSLARSMSLPTSKMLFDGRHVADL